MELALDGCTRKDLNFDLKDTCRSSYNFPPHEIRTPLPKLSHFLANSLSISSRATYIHVPVHEAKKRDWIHSNKHTYRHTHMHTFTYSYITTKRAM